MRNTAQLIATEQIPAIDTAPREEEKMHPGFPHSPSKHSLSVVDVANGYRLQIKLLLFRYMYDTHY